MTDQETILEFIRDEADLEEDEVDVSTSLFRDQLLDSMNLTALITFLEETFSIRVKPMDIVFENLDTVNHMVAFIARKRAAAMPEAPAAGGLLSEGRGGVADPATAASGSADEPLHKLPYILGLAVQVILWTLVFLGIVIAVLVGGELTEFRYVGF